MTPRDIAKWLIQYPTLHARMPLEEFAALLLLYEAGLVQHARLKRAFEAAVAAPS